MNKASLLGVSKKLGNFTLDNISFSVSKSQIIGLVGKNGAGKTTTMRILASCLKPDYGVVNIFGQRKNTQRFIGYLAEGAPLYDEMTVFQFLNIACNFRGIYNSRKNKIDEMVEIFHLEKVINSKIYQLSKGYKRRVGFANAIIHDPDLLILDEPTDGLDPIQRDEIRVLIKNFKDKAIIISTHILDEISVLCDKALIIDNGRIINRTNDVKNIENIFKSLVK